MAKNPKPSTAPVPASEALAAVEAVETALAAIPQDLLESSGAGTDTIGSDDVRPARLLICQAGSPQRKPDDPKQIEGLQELDMFNDLSGEIYGRGPLEIVIIRCFAARHIQFAPMDEGGGVVDYDVPPNDPRTKFTTEVVGGVATRVAPVATKFYDYLTWLPEYSDVLVLSMKSTQLKVATRLNALLKLPLKIGNNVQMSPPAWARTFTLTTQMEKRDNYSWGNYALKPEGITAEETRATCKALFAAYANKNVVIERDNDDAIDAETTEEGGM